MAYPLIDRDLLAVLRPAHGLFNASVMLAFFYDGVLGLRIRGARRAGTALPVAAVRRHRRLGPRLALLAGAGFCTGLSLVLLDTGRVWEYPAHLLVGTAVVALLAATFLVSRRIRGKDSPWRRPHFVLGLSILALYLVQALLGLGVLL